MDYIDEDDIPTEEIVISNLSPEIISTEICSCGAEGTEDICPYQSDVGGVIEFCTCCEECRYNCFMDI